MAEHMMILGLEDPRGGSLPRGWPWPSASGKDEPCDGGLSLPATVVEGRRRIAAIHAKARQRAPRNPESGSFGVAPLPTQHSAKTNRTARPGALEHHFTMWPSPHPTSRGGRGWGPESPAVLLEWRARPWTPGIGPPRIQSVHGTRAAVPLLAPNWGIMRGTALRVPLRLAPRAGGSLFRRSS